MENLELAEWRDLCRHDKARVLSESYAMERGELSWINLKPQHVIAALAALHGEPIEEA